MKINGSNRINLNPYKANQDKQQQVKAQSKKDQVEISDVAKKMQAGQSFAAAREEKVAQIKQQVDSGQYQVKPEEVAKKLYEFWRQ